MAEQGFPKTTIREIADRANVNPALLHYYFGTNDDPARGQGYTHINLSVFSNRAAHEAYQAHPLHHEMRELMLARMEIVVCDYEVPGAAA